MLSIRDALGTRWNANWTGWAILILPTTLVVLLQEAETPFPAWWFVLVSAALQQIASLVVAFMIATPFRQSVGSVPLGASVAIWLMIGAVRGVIAGLFAEAFAGVDGDYAYRVFSWVLISVVWMPLFVYTMAQFDHRRELLARLATARSRRDAAIDRETESAVQFRRRVLGTVQETIAPALEEVRESLLAASAGAGSESLQTIGERLTQLAGDAGRIVDSAMDPLELEEVPERSLVLDAVNYEIKRPVVVALLTVTAIVPAVLPEALLAETIAGVAGDLAALFAGVLVLALGLLAVKRWSRRFSPATYLLSVLGITLLAGIAASATLIAIDSPLPLHDQVLATVLPIGFAFAAAVVLTAVSVASANHRVAEDILRLQEEAGSLGARSRRSERRLRDQVNSLMHGPVHGRLAACAMALNFLADEGTTDPARSAEVAAQVLGHLAAASADLELLARGGTHVPSRS